MPKSTTFSNDLALLIFNATAIADIAENDSSSPLTSLYVSLHESTPGIGGSQLTGETDYDNYVRVAVTRSGAGWTVSGGASENAALIQFATCGALGATLTHVAIGTASGGAGKVLYAGALASSLAVANQIQPQFNAGTLTITES
jgi:hypothetical protein